MPALLGIMLFIVVVIAIAKSGSPLGDRIMDTIGVVQADPQSLADADGVTLDVETLARVGQSEESTTAGRIACMWAIKNQARKRKVSIFYACTTGHYKDSNGVSQVAPFDGKFRRDMAHTQCSTYRQPSQETLVLAQQVFDGTTSDPTDGATHWFAPGLQDKMYTLGIYSKSADDIRYNYAARGMFLKSVDGVDSTEFYG